MEPAARAFVRDHTTLGRTAAVPEIALHLATESTPLWHATQAWLDERAVPPPYWAFAWAGGQALARYVLDHADVVRGKTVVDFGCGGGIVALAAARAGARRVLAVDRDPLALTAIALNAEANACAVEVVAADSLSTALEHSRLTEGVVLAGDVFYERDDAGAITSELRDAAGRGLTVLAACPGRMYTPRDLETLATIEVAGTLELEGRASSVARVLRF